ncbi:glutamyl aminopeptidase [Fructobacillus sp. M1-13]|uniref:Glutamyl aminopeptidase n=1 Tax=Fructobacillus papyriferae TaxID=2713171 RepID=A0ABS5QP37_9LACO|nr:glutamyl aminopeptidase [Fructobacillus papyriferae]MBS9334923.1 glutamyl aminopeptidase [Fructobacillus papyriferae]MCD2159593.1 glutamyl aminopeptidase [Fructobacillus papyriferae]
MDQTTWERIVKYTELQGTSGQEDAVRSAFEKDLTPLVDRVEKNAMGGLFGIKEGKADDPRVMFAAHFDEVGFMVAGILPTGALQVVALGGWNPMTVPAHRFTLYTKFGQYPVVSSSVAPHLLRGKEGGAAALKIEDILFDAGFESKEQAEAMGVFPGDFIVPETKTVKMANPNRGLSKAYDNRFGVSAVLSALTDLKEVVTPNTLIMGANGQEEVGLRGALPAVQQLQPDIFFAVDSSAANDLDNTTGRQGILDQGTLIRVFDPTVVTSPRLKEFILQTAEDQGIPYQYFVSKGGTDAGAVQKYGNGMPAVALGVASRYIHTHETVWSIPDFDAARELIVALSKKLDRATVDDIVGL